MPPEVVEALKRSGRWQEGERHMIGELGQLALCFALALSLVMAVAGLMGARADAATARADRQRLGHGHAGVRGAGLRHPDLRLRDLGFFRRRWSPTTATP